MTEKMNPFFARSMWLAAITALVSFANAGGYYPAALFGLEPGNAEGLTDLAIGIMAVWFGKERLTAKKMLS